MAVDTALTKGDHLMAFGDSLLDTPASQETSVRNALLALAGDRACLVLGPRGSAFVPDRIDGVGYWPTSLVEVRPDSTQTSVPASRRCTLTSMGYPTSRA